MTNKTIIEKLNWRYAVKKFDVDKKIPEEKVKLILDAANLTATSLGIQPFKILLVDDPEILSSLKKISYNQESVSTCSHLIIICAETNVDETYIDNYINFAEKQRNLEKGALSAYEKMCKSFINNLDLENKTRWITNQAYIVLGNLLTVCADLEIDSCPMEGFNPILLDELFNLKEQNLRSVLMLPMGYRASDDVFAQIKKLRKPIDEMVIKIENT